MTPGPTGEPLLREEQRFRDTRLGLLLFGSAALELTLPVFILREVLGDPSRELPSWGIAVIGGIFVLGLLILWFAIVGGLDTEILAGGIAVQFRPLTKRHFYRWSEIESIEARKYRPIFEYGGWGIRGFRKNRAYNVSGSEGLQLVFKDGKRLLIGSQQAAALEEVARKAKETAT